MQVEIEGLLFCMTKLAKTLEPTQLENIQSIIVLATRLGDEYIAMRLQITKFIIAISRLLGQHGTGTTDLVKQFMQYILVGFQNRKLTLQDSSYAFGALCQDCAVVLAPYTQEYIDQILVPDFVATWRYEEVYQDIICGFGSLINEVYATNPDQTKDLLTAVVRPILVPLSETIQMVVDKKAEENLEEG